MAPFNGDDDMLKNLAGKVVVVVGAAEGVGYSLSKRLHSLQAHVVLGDGEPAATSAYNDESEGTTRSYRMQVDTSNYSDLRDLFRKAFDIHGRIDHAMYCLNIYGETVVYGKEHSIDNIETAPDLGPMELNLKGAIYFARVALTYLNHEIGSEDKSLTFLSSNIMFHGVPFVPLWQVSLGGIILLMQALRPLASTQSQAPVRINVACPGLPAYPNLDQTLIQMWEKEGLTVNRPEHVAKLMCYMAAQQTIYDLDCVSRQLHGCVIMGTGDHYWEIDEMMQRNIEIAVGPRSWETMAGTRAFYRRLNLPLWRMCD